MSEHVRESTGNWQLATGNYCRRSNDFISLA